MNNKHDYADNEVKGFERYIPNTSTRNMLIAIPSSAVAAFYAAPNVISSLGFSTSSQETTFIGIILALSTALIVSILLNINLMFIISKFKHRRVTHYSNLHPNMSFSWLKSNASLKHWIFLTLIFIFGATIGYILNGNI